MEQDKGILEEIVDSLVKKTTDLDKRQAKLEEQSDTVKLLVPKVKSLEAGAASYPKVYIPDYSAEFKGISDQLGTFKEFYENTLDQLREKISALPITIPVRHEHHFEQKSKRVFILFIVMVIMVALLTGSCIGLAVENSHISDEANKFLILRGFYPDIAKEIDKAYASDADNLLRKAQAKIHEQQTLSEAAFAAKQESEEKAAVRSKRSSHKKPIQKRTEGR